MINSKCNLKAHSSWSCCIPTPLFPHGKPHPTTPGVKALGFLILAPHGVYFLVRLWNVLPIFRHSCLFSGIPSYFQSSIDGTQELLLPSVTNLGMVERWWMNWGTTLGAQRASQPFSPSLGRQSHELGIFQISRHDEDCLKQNKNCSRLPKDTHPCWYRDSPTFPSPLLPVQGQKNQGEREGKTPPTSSTKLLLLNSLGQPQVGHKAVCVSSE